MSDEHTDPPEHTEIARLLAEQGPTPAPPDLAADVMRQVHAEPRRARRLLPSVPRVRPALAYCAAAAVLLAVGFGIAHLGTGGTSSSGGVAAEDMRSAAGGGTLAPEVEANSLTITIAKADAKRLLGSRYERILPGTAPTAAQAGNAITVVVPSATFDSLSRKLHAAAARSTPGNRVTIVLRRR